MSPSSILGNKGNQVKTVIGPTPLSA